MTAACQTFGPIAQATKMDGAQLKGVHRVSVTWDVSHAAEVTISFWSDDVKVTSMTEDEVAQRAMARERSNEGEQQP